MDNIIEIIIFFFVIYSVLGSLFGKKKRQNKQPQQQKRKPAPTYSRRVPETSVPKKPSSQDILEELFGMKLPRTEENSGYSDKRQDDNLEYQSWDPQKDFEKKVAQKEKYGYRNIEKKIPDINYDKITALENAQKKINSAKSVLAYTEKKKIDKRTSEIKKKLRDPRTIRDLYLISEILNKPKALRQAR
ncbi:MAG: hypothetical protein RDU14_03420 [Melioribacteraceae bacterium]|nr:hypothetical protein [Melioribacteraceae bacterium]